MDSQWLKTQFELHPGKTKRDLAAALGLEPPAISKILNGTRQIKALEYATMRRFFGLPVDGERSVKGDGSASYTLESLPSSGLQERNGKNNGEWVIPADILDQRTSAEERQVKVYRVNETTMEPDFRIGEPVLVDLSDTTASPPGAFVVSDGFGYMVRLCEYVPGSKPREVKISAKSKNFSPQTLKEDEFRLIGRIIGKLQWL